MYKYKLILAYDGTEYGGWQIQKNAISIQALVQEALSTVLRTPIQVTAAGRTDAGVHARGQVAHFTSALPLNVARLQNSLNGLLPHDIRMLYTEKVPSTFHARYSVMTKEYHYHLHLDRVMDPFKRLYSTHILTPLNTTLMQEAAELFIGTHDFTTFANEAAEGSAAKNPIRTLKRLDLIQEKGGIRLEFEGDGFLYKMVRNLTGTLLDVGRSKITPEAIPLLLQAKDRRLASAAAPPHGLFLIKVVYPEMLENRDAPAQFPDSSADDQVDKSKDV
jgi:tRNA pseudouridine38-40 synthase